MTPDQHHEVAAIASKIRAALAKIDTELTPKMVAAYREANQNYEATDWAHILSFDRIDKACQRLEERAAKMARQGDGS